MTDTTRDLIQRLADELDLYRQMARDDCTSTHPFSDEARAFLDQPEPKGPTDEEIEKRFQRWWFDEGSGMRPSNGEDQEEHTRRVSQIAWSNGAYVARYDCPTTTTETPEALDYLDQPEPEEPTEEELNTMLYYEFTTSTGHGERIDPIGFALAVRARWPRAAIKPVPVSERLPGPEDCVPWPDEPDANHWCWLGKSIDGGWEWSQTSALNIAAVQLERVLAGGGWTHWLPHYALPVPTFTETP